MRTRVLLISVLLSTMVLAQKYGIYQDCGKNGEIYIKDGTENGHDGVNLGLSVKWATCNVGASMPEGYGNYYAWGETSSKPVYNYYWGTYKYGNSSNSMTKYCANSSYGIVDNKTILEKADDAANVNWGGSWRMPTKAEWDELMNNCTATWTSNYNGTGVAGRIFTSKKIGYIDRSVFLPAAGVCNTAGHRAAGSNGFYWSSSLTGSYPDYACELSFDLYQIQETNGVRCYGFSVRPVCSLEKTKTDTMTLYATGCSTPNTIIAPEDSTITINAWAQENYHFVQWLDGVTDNPRSITVNGNATYTAVFAPNRYTISTTSSNGTITGGGTYNYGDTVTLAAIPNVGYHFTQWSDGNTDNPRIIVVSNNLSFSVNFFANAFDTLIVYQQCQKNGRSTRFGILGTTDNHDWIDLGLPSGTKWATCNLGASKPDEYGNYYAWGEVTTKKQYLISNYKHCSGTSYSMTKYCVDSDFGVVDNKQTLETIDDAVMQNWGKNWRMPTQDECQELLNACYWTWGQQNDITGCVVTSKYASKSNSIFLPAAGYKSNATVYKLNEWGYYWTSSLPGGYCNLACYFGFYESNSPTIGGFNYRERGQTIRPVCITSVPISRVTLQTNGCYYSNKYTIPTFSATIITAIPQAGYCFTQWSDGNADNPRQVVVTQDSTFIAEFSKQIDSTQIIDVAVYGDCSKNGYNKDFTHIAAVNSSSGRTSCEWVQLWEGGPKWATFNVGATITDYANLTKGADLTSFFNAFDQVQQCNTDNAGGLYAWNNPNFNGRKTTWTSSISTGISDVATTLWGSNWKTPTKTQIDTLQNSTYGKTTWTWCDGSTTQYVEGCSLKGFKVSGKGKYTENAIFLPAAGYFNVSNGNIVDPGNVGHCWSSTKYGSDYIYSLTFRSLDYNVISDVVYSSQWYGLSVRAVLVDNTVPTDNVTLTLKTNDCEANNVITCIKDQPLRITATDSECSKFVRWSDGTTKNPRVVSINGNCAYTAIFEKINYTITLDADEKKGTVVEEK